MKPQRIAIKLFASPDPSAPVELEPFTAIFHEFIQKGSVPGLLVDVADYAHVPNGPGIVLIGHDIDYGIDSVGGRSGLLCVRKRFGTADLAEVARDTLARAVACAVAIEADTRAPIRFDGSGVELQLLDRLAAPNDEATFETARGELEALFGELYGACTLERSSGDDARKPASLEIRADGDVALSELAAKLGDA